MAFPSTVAHQGALQGAPTASSVGTPSLTEILNTSFSNTYGSSKAARPGIVGATVGSPYVIPFETITKVRMFAFRVRGGSLEFRLTSAKGVDQALACSDIWLWHSPFAGDEITAIKVIGTADLEYVIAGDVS